jgi:hypothetical protein
MNALNKTLKAVVADDRATAELEAAKKEETRMNALNKTLKAVVAEFDRATAELEAAKEKLVQLGWTEEAWAFDEKVYTPASRKVSALNIDVAAAVENITVRKGVTMYTNAGAWGNMYKELLAEARK